MTKYRYLRSFYYVKNCLDISENYFLLEILDWENKF